MSRITQENIRRNKILDAEYNPLLGIGSTIERQLFQISDLEKPVYLPISMSNLEWVQKLGEAKSIKEYIRRHRYDNELLATSIYPEDLIPELFIQERLNHDFEFWAATCINITHKDNFKDVPFILRGAQRKLLFTLESMRLAGVPIRIVLLKARQWGGSTLVQFYMMWIQQRNAM